MYISKSGIRVVSFVHTANGLVDFEDLTEEQKRKAATELKLRYLNCLFEGQAKFEEAAT